MDFVSHREITLIFIGKSAAQLICVYYVYMSVSFHSMAENLLYLRMFKWLYSYGTNNVVQFSCTFKTKVFAAEDNS